MKEMGKLESHEDELAATTLTVSDTLGAINILSGEQLLHGNFRSKQSTNSEVKQSFLLSQIWTSS